MAEDSRLNAARYRANRAAREHGYDAPAREAPPEAPQAAGAAEPERHAGTPTAHERAMYVETAIQQAIRRGDFDDLPGYGKPLEGLGDHHDPDWWIRRKIQTEKLTGLGPPALQLRVEHAEFAACVDALRQEREVREYVEDFNRRVIEARRQLQGGPPVVTPTHDVDEEIQAWRRRRTDREAAAPAPGNSAQDPAADASRRRRRWWLLR